MLYALLIGLIAGVLADYLRKDQSYGIIVNVIIGVLGAGIGWWLNNNVLHLANKQGGLTGIIVGVLVALVGSSILLAIIGFFKKA